MPSAIILIVLLLMVAAGLVLTGIYILAGLAPTLIAGGVALFAAAECLRRGLIPNG